MTVKGYHPVSHRRSRLLPFGVAMLVSFVIFCVGVFTGSTLHGGRSEIRAGTRITLERAHPMNMFPGGEQPLTAPGAEGCPDCVVSEAVVRGSVWGNSSYVKTRYIFRNVHLADNDTLSLFVAPDAPRPRRHYEVSLTHQANYGARLPTVMSYHRDHPAEMVEIGVKYSTAGAEAQPRCARWEDRPVYLVTNPHPTNIWHILNDALMGAFQTLREEGLLPLAEVDAAGNLKEHTADLEKECPWTMVPEGDGQPYRAAACARKTGLVTPRQCDPRTEPWCRQPGLVSVNRADPSNAPILLLAKGSHVPSERWMGFFHALSHDVRPWEAEVGTCFRELYVGKSNLLNFYMGLFNDYPAAPHTQGLRRAALATFQGVMATAERDQRRDGGAEWPGYADPELEELRRGVDTRGIDALGALRRSRTAALLGSKYEPADKAALQDQRRQETAAMRGLLAEKLALGDWGKPGVPAEEVAVPPEVPAMEAPRPVVTFMWRKELKRCVINEADVLEYILARYNVTIKVTTFEEPLLETMDLMSSTDVLIGMHGAGWTNAFFLKPGAGALQLHPYGWRPPSRGEPIRGQSYRNICRSKRAVYHSWVNPSPEHAVMRMHDFAAVARRGVVLPYNFTLHPAPEWETPSEGDSYAHWIYQNTVVDVRTLAPKIDAIMAAKGVPRLAPEVAGRLAAQLAAQPDPYEDVTESTGPINELGTVTSD